MIELAGSAAVAVVVGRMGSVCTPSLSATKYGRSDECLRVISLHVKQLELGGSMPDAALIKFKCRRNL
eukprot:scaffold3107_cov77-Skeletonema_dohrnii-CCMP3373.AAC.9